MFLSPSQQFSVKLIFSLVQHQYFFCTHNCSQSGEQGSFQFKFFLLLLQMTFNDFCCFFIRNCFQVGPFKFTGYMAWLTWLFVHLLFLVGFRNKVAVLWQWAYSYVAYKRGSRIITNVAPISDEAVARTANSP